MKSINKLGIVLVGITALSGCFGGDDDDDKGSSKSDSDKSMSTGVLVDAPVGGVSYVTQSNSSEQVTNAQGEFEYTPGETVTFSVGGIELGEVLGDSLITPLELLGTSEITDEVVNMGQFLQSLDSDGDPDTNGITIDPAVAAALSFSAVSFDSPTFDDDIRGVFDDVFADDPRTLISNEDALAHIESTFDDLASDNPNGFTVDQLAGTTFYFLGDASDFDTDDEAESTYEIVFNEDSTGTIGLFDSDQTNPIEWLVKADGRLAFTESGSGGDVFNLIIVVTDIDGDYINVSWSETRTENGEDGSDSGSGLFYTEERYPGYEIDLTTKIATSGVTKSSCTTYDREAGFYYSFTDTDLTRTGADNIDDETASCVVDNPEIQQFEMSGLSADFDLPFNCENFPLCDYQDLNKTVQYETEGVTVTSTYTHTPGSNAILYESVFPSGLTITETIMLEEVPADNLVDLTAYDVTSVITNSDCPGLNLGWDYTFTASNVTFEGTDGFSSGCIANEDEVFTESISVLLDYEGFFSTCIDYPVCTPAELNRTFIGTDFDGDEDVVITISHEPGSNTVTAVQNELLGSVWTEVISLNEPSDDVVVEVPEALSVEFLTGKTLYDVWYGIEDGFEGDDARVASITFNADGSAEVFGLVESNVDVSLPFTVDEGRLFFSEDDDGSGFEINFCGSSSQYLEIIYSENGEFNNIDRFYFNEQDALDYVSTLTDSIPETDCSDDSEVNALVGSWNFHFEASGDYDETILSFTDTGEFFFFNIDSDSSDACRERGFEYGTYELVGTDIILTRGLDTSACVGLFNTIDETSATLSITSQETQQLTIIDVAEDPLTSFTITRILTNEESIVGSWHEAANEGGDLNQGNDLSNLVLFLGDGRFYSMDVDLSESAAQDNSFNFGDYTFDLGGAGLSLTRRFDSVGEFTLDEAQAFPNADIVNNELFINSVDDQFGIGRVSSDADNPSALLAFTAAELEDGFTWFFPLLEPEDCGSEWRIEEMIFNTNGYSLDFCGLGFGDEVDEAFVVLDSGVVELVETEEYVNRVSFDAELQAYLVCWADTEQEALSCPDEVRGLGFLSREGAQAYADQQ